MVGRWTTDLKVSVRESSNPIIDVFHNLVSDMILKFVKSNNANKIQNVVVNLMSAY